MLFIGRECSFQPCPTFTSISMEKMSQLGLEQRAEVFADLLEGEEEGPHRGHHVEGSDRTLQDQNGPREWYPARRQKGG